MAWEPIVLRKYNSISHYRLLAQLRAELLENPLVRPAEGERIGDVNRSKMLIRAIEARQSGQQRSGLSSR